MAKIKDGENSQSKKVSIMLVDDEPGIGMIFKKLMPEYNIDYFEHPYDGIEQLRIKKYQILILDYLMPDLNGDRFIQLMMDYNIHMEVILLSGNLVPNVDQLKIAAYVEKSINVVDTMKPLIDSMIVNIEASKKKFEDDIVQNAFRAFSINLKVLRLQSGESQKELADFLDVTRQTITAYEAGMNEPDLKKLVLIAHHYNVTLDYLLNLNQH